MSQTARVLAGLVAGILIGILLAWQAPDLGLRIAAIVEPFGKLWLNALQMTVVPLVFALVVVGINQASDAAHSGRVARQAITSFVVLLAGAGTMTALLAPLALSQLAPDPAVAAALRGHGEAVATTGGAHRTPATSAGPGNSSNAELLAGQGLTPGAEVSANGYTFTWPNVAPGVADNVIAAGQLIKLAGSGSTLAFLGSEAGDSTGAVTVHYTDGSTSTANVGFPNWSFSDPTEFGAKLAFSTKGRNTPTGLSDTAYDYRLFTNTIPLDAGKQVASVELPQNSSIHVFAWSIG